MTNENFTTDELLMMIVQRGYTFSLQAKDDGTYGFWICRKEWVTSNMAQARELPASYGNTPREAILDLINGEK